MINRRFDSLENSIEQIQTTGECSNDSTGTFLDPAHNCSHILLDHPGSPSGSDIHTYLWVVMYSVKHTQVSTGFKGAMAMQ